jgi:hypothetical protein
MLRGLKREVAVIRFNREVEEGSESHFGQTSHKLCGDGRCHAISKLTVKSLDCENKARNNVSPGEHPGTERGYWNAD